MFTGIVQSMVEVRFLQRTNHFLHYCLFFPQPLLHSLVIGASVSINGICQTVVAINQETGIVSFDAIEETLKRTTLNQLEVGDWVNVERSAKMGDEIGGHLMSGHIIGKAIIEERLCSQNQCTLSLRCDPTWMKYILPKGFIGLNGASLTVGETSPEGRFFIHLIPETLRQTTFGKISVGDEVNVELCSQTQAIVDTVERVMAQSRTAS